MAAMFVLGIRLAYQESIQEAVYPKTTRRDWASLAWDSSIPHAEEIKLIKSGSFKPVSYQEQKILSFC